MDEELKELLKTAKLVGNFLREKNDERKNWVKSEQWLDGAVKFLNSFAPTVEKAKAEISAIDNATKAAKQRRDEAEAQERDAKEKADAAMARLPEIERNVYEAEVELRRLRAEKPQALDIIARAETAKKLLAQF